MVKINEGPMSEQQELIEQTQSVEEQSEALRIATERAEAAEAELARLRSSGAAGETRQLVPVDHDGAEQPRIAEGGGVEELRKDSMMAHLLDSLEAGKDIGHYGRLVFAMVSRHFLPHDEVLRYLTMDHDFSEEQALLMLRQVEGRDYNPPKRERILEWQSQQDFPILPRPDDPDCGNLYRNLKFPDAIYDHISHYQEEKIQAGE
jgi:hypothetical protein